MPSAPGEGRLFVVGTPIGNLGDLTERARRVLAEVGVVAAEDTRRARALLSHLGVTGKDVVRLDANSGAAEVARLADRIAAGESVAMVTDAGTPGISDPGGALVKAAALRGATVVPIPGASAVVTALSVSGFAATAFRFLGFLPRGKKERTEALARIADDHDAVVFLEAPTRITETLEELARMMPEREALLARELTKVHEELLRGTLRELAEAHGGREWLGEITMVLGPYAGRGEPASDDGAMDARIDALLAEGRRAREVAELVALELGLSKRTVYERVHQRSGRGGRGRG
jgi:16S rRNA (cytidine1402-2'-O)-methyltransferase